jgi:hypothetical protein
MLSGSKGVLPNPHRHPPAMHVHASRVARLGPQLALEPLVQPRVAASRQAHLAAAALQAAGADRAADARAGVAGAPALDACNVVLVLVLAHLWGGTVW